MRYAPSADRSGLRVVLQSAKCAAVHDRETPEFEELIVCGQSAQQ
jgi:hypothetical protein